MKKTVRKWWWAWDFEKEEKWLNDMAAEGWVLCGTGFCRYEFEKCEPGEYTVRLEFLEHLPGSAEGGDYIRFLEETGAEHVGSYMRWAYFRKKAVDGVFDIYSDTTSRVAHLRRMQDMIAPIAAANLCIGLANLGHSKVGFINLGCAALLAYAAWRLEKMKKRLREEGSLFE